MTEKPETLDEYIARLAADRSKAVKQLELFDSGVSVAMGPPGGRLSPRTAQHKELLKEQIKFLDRAIATAEASRA